MCHSLKKMISLALCLLLYLSVLPVSAHAAQSGQFEYTVSGGEATVTEYNGNAKKVDIPSRLGGYPVTAIGENAFWYNTDVESITIPNSVTTIEDDAFCGCQSLKSLAIPAGVTFIGDSAFADCKSMKSFTIPEGITSIGEYTFSWCESLSAITLPKNLKSIGEGAFWCAGITKITIPAGVTSIELDAFTACDKLSSITVAADNPSYRSYDGALYNKALTKLITAPRTSSGVFTVPAGVTSIGIRAFMDCTRLTGVILPKSIKTIEKSAFFECSRLKTVYYYGSATDKKAISIDNEYGGNDELLQASWICGFKGYIDVTDPGKYFYDAVYWAKDSGVTTGTSTITFSPYAKCTRAQIVTFLWRAMGSPKVSTANPFRDVKATDWFYDAVLWAYSRGITTGTSSTTFSPGNTCTRAQIVTFLWRAKGSPEPGAAANPFKDVKTSDWFYKPVMWAVQNGITTGTSKTAFSPGGTCTRGQGVTFLYRAMR